MFNKIKVTLPILLTLSVFVSSCATKITEDLSDPSVSAFATGTIEDVDTTYVESFVTNSLRTTFNEYDKNKNGFIESQELSQAPLSFKKLDRNNDNRLSFDEAKYSNDEIKKMSQRIYSFYSGMFKSMDSNKNGSLSTTEMSQNPEFKAILELNAYNNLKNTTLKNSSTSSISMNEFSIFMNSSLIEIQKKNTNLLNSSPKNALNKKLPVILVQGYAEPSWYFMYGIYRNLKKSGWDSVYTVNLFPNISDIKEQAKTVANKIEQAKKEQGVSKVDYVAHSMGGLIGRYYIQEMNGANSINHFVSVATPHYGTYIAWAGPGDGAKQMRPGSDFLSRLNSGNPIYGGISYTSIWTKTDEIVIPAENALLQGSKQMPPISSVGHFLILWSETTYKQIKSALNDENNS
ncbi:MAG: alpha/beta fold hydrolase [Cyanobacteriota bacterium]